MRVTTRLEQSTTARHYSTLLTGNNFRHTSFEQNGLKRKRKRKKGKGEREGEKKKTESERDG